MNILNPKENRMANSKTSSSNGKSTKRLSWSFGVVGALVFIIALICTLFFEEWTPALFFLEWTKKDIIIWIIVFVLVIFTFAMINRQHVVSGMIFILFGTILLLFELWSLSAFVQVIEIIGAAFMIISGLLRLCKL